MRRAVSHDNYTKAPNAQNACPYDTKAPRNTSGWVYTRRPASGLIFSISNLPPQYPTTHLPFALREYHPNSLRPLALYSLRSSIILLHLHLRLLTTPPKPLILTLRLDCRNEIHEKAEDVECEDKRDGPFEDGSRILRTREIT